MGKVTRPTFETPIRTSFLKEKEDAKQFEKEWEQERKKRRKPGYEKLTQLKYGG